MAVTKSKFLADVRSVVGQKLDVDGVYGAQCVDLINYFYKKYWDFRAWGNAIDFANNSMPSGFTRYSAGRVAPQAGDILVWRLSNSDHFGHIGICVEVNGGMVTSVEQNVDGNNDYLKVGGPARLKARNTNRLVSIIRPKFDPEATKSLDEVAREVINGAWGNGSDRVSRLKSAGYDPEAVQNRVNAMLSGSKPAPKKSVDEIAKEVLAGKWGNGAERKERLTKAGYNYEAVQSKVNSMLNSSSSSSSAIKVGDSVKVINPVDYNGTRIALYYDRYTVMELRGDRAVIGVNGTVTCAIKVSNLRK